MLQLSSFALCYFHDPPQSKQCNLKSAIMIHFESRTHVSSRNFNDDDYDDEHYTLYTINT